jgi:hypothetical protein
MTERTAACFCGQLSVRCKGEPVWVSVCHCLACQQRTGSVFGAQARFLSENVIISGASTAFVRTGDEGRKLTYNFCPQCGSTIYYVVDDQPELIAVPVGAFADAGFPPPKFSVYERRKHGWVAALDGPDVAHLD